MLFLAAFLPSKSVMNVKLTARVLIFFFKLLFFVSIVTQHFPLFLSS